MGEVEVEGGGGGQRWWAGVEGDGGRWRGKVVVRKCNIIALAAVETAQVLL